MARVVYFETFRALKACRSIEAANAQILAGLARMQEDTRRTQSSLERAGRRLEDALGHYDMAQERLTLAHAQHRRIMAIVDHIMETSPVFRDIPGARPHLDG